MSIMKGRSKGMAAFSLVCWSSLLSALALGGCGSDKVDEPIAEATMAVCAASPVTDDCMNWSFNGTQWCTTTAKAADTACTISGSPVSPGQCDGSGTCASAGSWEYGNFRGLPNGNPSSLTLAAFVAGLSHGTSFTPLSSTRQGDFDDFVDALIDTAEDSLTNPYADWCTVRDLANTAGYEVTRFYDSTTSRWYVYAYDTQSTGHAYFFYNPEPRRSVIFEAPHTGSPGSLNENDTSRQAVYLFQELAGRGLVINGADRCQGSDSSPPTCGGTYTGDVCGSGTAGDPYHESDVAHSPTNAFHRFHAQLNADADNSFVQLHGRSGSGKEVTAGDGRNDSLSATNSMSNNYKTELEALDTTNIFTTYSCQDGSANTYCGETNSQGRFTAGGSANSSKPGCFFAGVVGSRFLHLEQKSGFLNPSNTPSQNSWDKIASALEPITNCIQVMSCNSALPAQDASIGSLTDICN